VFLEAGSGSSQTSILINKKFRNLYCLDFSFEALTHAIHVPVITGGIQGDLFYLPLRAGCIDGIWNLGVMEHYTDTEICEILNAFYQILKPDAYAILFWPPLLGWYKVIAVFIEKILSLLKRQKVNLYPNEINLFRSRRKIQCFCNKTGFNLEHCRSLYLDLFTYTVVVIRKKQEVLYEK